MFDWVLNMPYPLVGIGKKLIVEKKKKKSFTLIWKGQKFFFLLYSEAYLGPSRTFMEPSWENSLRLKAPL